MPDVIAQGVPCGEKTEAFHEWCIVELMGHRRIGAKVSEAQIAGSQFLRLEIPNTDGSWTTQFYRPEAVYCLTPSAERIARAIAQQFNPPVSRFDIPELPHSASDDRAIVDDSDSPSDDEVIDDDGQDAEG